VQTARNTENEEEQPQEKISPTTEPTTEPQGEITPTVSTAPTTPVDEKRKAFEEAGYTPEQTEALFNYDASKGPYLSFLKQNLQKPEPLSPEAEKRMRILGMLGDSLGILSQLYGASQGARISRNNPENSVTRYTEKYIDRLRNIYDGKLNTYNSQLLNAGYHDIAYENTLRKEINDVYYKQMQNKINKQKLDLQSEKNTLEKQLKEAKDERESKRLEADLKKIDADITNNEKRTKILQQRAYRSGTGGSGKSGGSGKNKEYDVDAMAAEAINDSEYMKSLPDEMFTIRADIINGKIKTVKDKQILAADYYRKKYGKDAPKEETNGNSTGETAGWY
jgi:hypothetical protein